MGNDHWPLFDLEVRTPRLTLRYLDDALAAQLVAVAARGVHDPATMPFLIPWTDRSSPQREHDAMRFYWQNRVAARPESWTLQFGVVVDGEVVGACDVGGDHFPSLREVTTGSWLGREFQGRGLGKEFRMAALTLAFDGFGAEFALTTMWHDNGASRGVTESLGYEFEGRRRALRRGVADDLRAYRMTRGHWATIRRDDITLHGVDAARDFLGIDA
jgi:RimJ/RimL family protein N-acetyltransferase